MREILFRGKRTDNDEWIKGYLHKTDGVGKGYRAFAIQVQDIDSYMCRPHSHEVQPKTVGQYTGLTDKNGKKIFEGDIVKFHTETYTSESDTIGKIEYFNGTFGISYKYGKHFLEFINMSMYVRWYEVIGNIHDNPELLEKDNV